MQTTIKNTGSQARDFCMLDRNLQAHLRLALLLSVVSSSVLLKSRLVPDDPSKPAEEYLPKPIAYALFGASMLTITAGLWEFVTSSNDLLRLTAFLRSPRVHYGMMTIVICVIFATCILVLIHDK